MSSRRISVVCCPGRASNNSEMSLQGGGVTTTRTDRATPRRLASTSRPCFWPTPLSSRSAITTTSLPARTVRAQAETVLQPGAPQGLHVASSPRWRRASNVLFPFRHVNLHSRITARKLVQVVEHPPDVPQLPDPSAGPVRSTLAELLARVPHDLENQIALLVHVVVGRLDHAGWYGRPDHDFARRTPLDPPE